MPKEVIFEQAKMEKPFQEKKKGKSDDAGGGHSWRPCGGGGMES